MSEIRRKLERNPSNYCEEYYLEKLFSIRTQLEDDLNKKLDISMKLAKMNNYYFEKNNYYYENEVRRLLVLIRKIDFKINKFINNTLNFDFDDLEDSANFILKYVYDLEVKHDYINKNNE